MIQYKNHETAVAVSNSWYGFLGTDLVYSLIHDFDRTPLAGTTSPVLFAGKYTTANPGDIALVSPFLGFEP